MKMMNKSNAPIAFHFKPLIMALFIAFGCVIARLVHLQLITSLKLFQQSRRNYLRYAHVASPRGNIFDCHGTLIATNRPLIRLVWQGTGNRVLSAKQEETITFLKSMVDFSEESVHALKKAERKRSSCVIQEQLSFHALGILLEKFPEHANLALETHFQRFYPFGTSACHTLGYINDISRGQHGIMGLEKICNSLLQGVSGQLLTTINSFGHTLSREEIQRTLMGDNVYTTLDMHLHQLAEEAFPADASGALIVMEATTGALRVVVSRPAFDPNIFIAPISSASWQQLMEQKALLNRAFSACYPPASLFKLVTLTAALDTGIISPQDTWHCLGYTTFRGRSYSCNDQLAHGTVTIEQALAKSCNLPLFEIGRKIKINTLAQYAHWLCLGAKTNDMLGDKQGLIPTAQWKQQLFGEPWWPGETLSATIGQSFILVTPLQICRMIGAICQGYAVTPHLLATTPVERVPSPISSNILQIIKQYMRQVVLSGTGKSINVLQEMHVYAKTGTAQVCALRAPGGAPLAPHEQPHAWFAAHITYKQHEPIVLVIILEHAGSSRVALGVAKKFLAQYQKYVDGELA
jgi:penicillin-binding protein 2